jgi:hypothetical protein
MPTLSACAHALFAENATKLIAARETKAAPLADQFATPDAPSPWMTKFGASIPESIMGNQ